MPILHVHSYELFLIARTLAKRARLDADRPNALATDSLGAVVMAAAAAESFLNELAYHVEIMSRSTADWAPQAVTQQLSACAREVRTLEDKKAKTAKKYMRVSELLGSPFKSVQAPFQDFQDLVSLRNEIIHCKPVRNGDHLGERIAANLEQRGIAKRLFPAQTRPGFTFLKTLGSGHGRALRSLGSSAQCWHCLQPRRSLPRTR